VEWSIVASIFRTKKTPEDRRNFFESDYGQGLILTRYVDLNASKTHVSVDYLLGRTNDPTPPGGWDKAEDIPQYYIDQMFIGAEGYFGEEMTPHDREVIETMIRTHIAMKSKKRD
jgi:hypothetical protein